MYLLVAVLNNEELLEELITGWLDMGITGATVIESTDILQLISYNIPIFAGFRSLTSGGTRHNKTLLVAIDDGQILNLAVNYLESICRRTEKPNQGVYFVTPLLHFRRLGLNLAPEDQQRHIEKKLGKPAKETEEQGDVNVSESVEPDAP